MVRAIYLEFMDANDEAQVDDLNTWLDETHIPQMLKLGGCAGAERGVLSLDQQKGMVGPRQRFLTLFQIDTPSLPDFLREMALNVEPTCPALDRQRLWRVVYLQMGDRHTSPTPNDSGASPVRIASFVFVGPKDPNDVERYSTYMDELHVREMLAVPGCVAGTRYRHSPDQPLNAVGPNHPFLNLWEAVTESGAEYQRQLSLHPRTPTPVVDVPHIHHVNYELR